MTVKFLITTIFLCLGLTLSNADISEVKASAIQKLETQRKKIDELAFKMNIPTEQDKMQTQTLTRLDYGYALSERAHFEIEQLAVASLLIADLMKAGKDVVECMAFRKEEAQKENEKFLMDRFYRPDRESEGKSARAEIDYLIEWSARRRNLYNEYNKLYDDALNDIKNTENLSEISFGLNKVLPKGEAFVEYAREVIEKANKFQWDHLAFGDESLNALREFVRSRVDKTEESLQDCFVVNTAYYKIKNILSKSM